MAFAVITRPLDAPRSRDRARALGRVVGVALGSWLALASGPGQAEPPRFTEPEPAVSQDGTVQLEWEGDVGDYEVQLRSAEGSRITYRGRLPYAHVSGLPNGEYGLRVRAREGDGWSEWSAPKEVEVRHHSMALVWTLLSLGLVVFSATAAVVLRSSRGEP